MQSVSRRRNHALDCVLVAKRFVLCVNTHKKGCYARHFNVRIFPFSIQVLATKVLFFEKLFTLFQKPQFQYQAFHPHFYGKLTLFFQIRVPTNGNICQSHFSNVNEMDGAFTTAKNGENGTQKTRINYKYKTEH